MQQNKKITGVLAVFMAATCCEAAPLEVSEPEWNEYKNLFDSDDNGAIDNGKLGDELRGRASQ